MPALRSSAGCWSWSAAQQWPRPCPRSSRSRSRPWPWRRCSSCAAAPRPASSSRSTTSAASATALPTTPRYVRRYVTCLLGNGGPTAGRSVPESAGSPGRVGRRVQLHPGGRPRRAGREGLPDLAGAALRALQEEAQAAGTSRALPLSILAYVIRTRCSIGGSSTLVGWCGCGGGVAWRLGRCAR